MSIVNEWPMVKLGDLGRFISGGTPNRKRPEFYEGSIPWISSADLSDTGKISTRRSITEEAIASSATKLVPAHTILIATRIGVGKVAITSEEMCFSQDIVALVDIDEAIVSSSFLKHMILIARPYLQGIARGVTIKGISTSDLQRLELPLPPLDEQQRIADMLNASAEIIHKEEHLQRSILPLVINIVEKKVASPDSTLGNLIESMSSGKNVAESPDPNQQNRVLKVSAVTSGTFKPAESKPLPDTYLPPKTHQVRKGDILVSRANTTELLGASALVENDVESLYLPDKIWRVTPKDGVDPYLLWSILQAKTVRARISQRATGSSGSMKNISQKNFLQVPCTTFSRSESVKLAALIREAVSVHHQITQNLTRLRSLHHSLSTRAFAGQL